MSAVEDSPPPPPRLKRFLAGSALLHAAVFLVILIGGGLFGVEGPGGGDKLYFQLAAGPGQDTDAAADIDGSKEAVFSKADIDPAPQPAEKPEKAEEPEPDPEAVPLERNQRTSQEKTTQVQGEARQAEAGRSTGTSGDDTQGSSGEAEQTILNQKGTLMSGVEVARQSSGHTFRLEMGRIDIQGGNRLTNTVIKLHPDGTSDVELTYYHHRTFHQDYSSTTHKEGEGRWWIEGDMWCHQSPIISYNTKDCYHMTQDEAGTVRLYYDKCTIDSSSKCKTGRIAAEGRIE